MADVPKWSKKTRESFCQNDLLLVPFDRYGPDALPFNDAVNFCKALGGNMSMPKSLQDENRYHDIFIKDVMDESLISRYFWYPVTDQDGGPWINILTGKEPSYTNWDTREPNGGIAENCTVVSMYSDVSRSGTTHFWADYRCSTKIGFICEVLNNIRLELLGLCTESALDKEYAGSSIVNGRRAFQGKYDYQVKWDDENNYWTIKSDSNPDVYAFYNHTSKYPLGILLLIKHVGSSDIGCTVV